MPLELKKEDLQNLIKEILTATAPDLIKTQLGEVKTMISEVERKAIFTQDHNGLPAGEFKLMGQLTGTCINPAALMKAMESVQSKGALGITVSDKDFANMVINGGGIFTKLSPAMEQFAHLLKAKLNPSHLVAKGWDSKGYREACDLQLKQTGMNEGTGADGGFTVPVEYSATVIEFAIRMSAILSRTWRVPMKSNQAKWPRLAQDEGSFFGGFHFHWIDEGESKPHTKAKFEQLTFNAYKCAAICVLTDELIEDSLINIVNYITALGIRAWMYELEHAVIDGTGIGQPMGFTNDPVVIGMAVTRTTGGTVSWDDLLKLEAALSENFMNPEWVLRRGTLSTIRNLRVTGSNQPVWHETWGSFNNTPTMTPTIISYPYHITRNAPAIGQRADLSLCDLGFYMLAVRKDMTIDISSYPWWETDETGIRFVARVDGKVGTPYAFKILSGTGS